MNMTLNPDGSSPSENDTTIDPNNADQNLQGEGGNGADANNAAASSGAGEDANKPTSLLDAVKSVVQPKPADASSALGNQAPGSDQTQPKPDAQKEGAVKSEAELLAEDASLEFHKHPRFQQLLKESKEGKQFKSQLDDVTRQVGELTIPATEHGKIVAFMQDNGLNDQEVAIGYQIMAALKNDPLKARDMLLPYMEKLDLAAGVKLPSDLQEALDAGHINLDVAQRAARERFTASFVQQQNSQLQERNQQTLQQQQEQQQQQQQQQLMGQVNDAVVAWEANIKTIDPDYSKKQPLIYNALTAMTARLGFPKSSQEAMARAKQAHDDVTAQLKGMLPNRQPVTPTPGGQSSANAVPQAKTLSEAIKLAANGQLNAV